jgi:hypothetical protein
MIPKAAPASPRTVLADNPLDGEELLVETLYGEHRAPRRQQSVAAPASRPQHYKIVSISLYNEDIDRLEALVRELKRRGHYRANKSQLIRHAIAQLNLDLVPKG